MAAAISAAPTPSACWVRSRFPGGFGGCGQGGAGGPDRPPAGRGLLGSGLGRCGRGFGPQLLPLSPLGQGRQGSIDGNRRLPLPGPAADGAWSGGRFGPGVHHAPCFSGFPGLRLLLPPLLCLFRISLCPGSRPPRPWPSCPSGAIAPISGACARAPNGGSAKASRHLTVPIRPPSGRTHSIWKMRCLPTAAGRGGGRSDSGPRAGPWPGGGPRALPPRPR